MAQSTCGCMCGWQMKLCDLSLIHAVSECVCGELLNIRLYIDVLFTLCISRTKKCGNEAQAEMSG